MSVVLLSAEAVSHRILPASLIGRRVVSNLGFVEFRIPRFAFIKKDHDEGGDWRGKSADGRRWRHIGIPLGGFASYQGVPQKAADYFDRILDTMCCGDCETCK